MEQSHQLLSIQKIKCPYGETSQLVCIQPQCSKPAFLCGGRKCNCMKADHYKCNTINIDYIFDIIDKQKQKISEQTKQNVKYIQKIYDQMINKITEAKAKLLIEVQQFVVKLLAQQLFTKIKNGKQNQIVGEEVWKIKEQIEKNHNLIIPLQLIKKKWEDQKQRLQKALQSLQLLKKPQSFIESQILQIFDQSKVKSFFTKPIKNTKLLFRASQHGFKSSDFHARCDNIQNTLTIVKTSHGRIIGGYTPIKWKNSQYKFEGDQSKQSFLFSVTLNEKYPLISQNFGVKSDKSSGPMFGDQHFSDLKIDNNCNTQNTSCASFPIAYNNGNYEKGNEATSAFLGNSQKYFRVDNYEVFQLKFLSNN